MSRIGALAALVFLLPDSSGRRLSDAARSWRVRVDGSWRSCDCLQVDLSGMVEAGAARTGRYRSQLQKAAFVLARSEADNDGAVWSSPVFVAWP